MLSYGEMRLTNFSRDFAHRYWLGAAAFSLASVAFAYLVAHGIIGLGPGIVLSLFGFAMYAVLLSLALPHLDRITS